MTSKHVGAVVLGGDFNGLGIVRSIGRRNAPVCVIDDEYSIAPVSHYTSHAVRVPDRRDETRTIEAVLDAGHRLGLEGWVLYPTRDEIVAALSRHRPALAGVFRVPTPEGDTVQWAGANRSTY